MTILMMFWALFASAYAQEPVTENDEYQLVQIYVDISEIITADGSTGTSAPLNVLISHNAQLSYQIKNRLQYWSNPDRWRGEVNVYDWQNVKHMPTFKNCDYGDAISCGVKNKHWTLRTVVYVGDKFSTITMKMYDDTGKQIAKGSHTAWGTIRWKPRWKITKIKEQGPFGGGTKEIFEMWPPEMQELPPLIKPRHIRQVCYSVSEINQRSCRSPQCEYNRNIWK